LRAQISDRRSQGHLKVFSLRASAINQIQEACTKLGLPRPTWHSFRRGAAQDALRAGCTLAQVLQKGGWRSSSFLVYLTRKDVDDRAALELALADSDSD
jgi:hypothetical protein